jgi:L-amino acid N-acyltransferase YncA
MKLICCDRTHLAEIQAIFNEAIANSTALYEYVPRSAERMAGWFDAKEQGKYPVIGAVSGTGELMGFASYGPFRLFPAYKYTVEHSVYVAAPFRGRGVGKMLLREVITAARSQEYHAMIGAIDARNATSIALHRSHGFHHGGTLRQVGFKFGEWLDLEFYQLLLPTPPQPVDG